MRRVVSVELRFELTKFGRLKALCDGLRGVFTAKALYPGNAEEIIDDLRKRLQERGELIAIKRLKFDVLLPKLRRARFDFVGIARRAEACANAKHKAVTLCSPFAGKKIRNSRFDLGRTERLMSFALPCRVLGGQFTTNIDVDTGLLLALGTVETEGFRVSVCRR